MVKYLILLLTCGSVNAQLFTFRVRKVPELKHFVFADEFQNHNLSKKKHESVFFPQRLYLQVFDNDTFIIRWSRWKLKEANIQLDYLKRDSLTYAGKLVRRGKKGMIFTFPFEDKTYKMFTIAEEPLVQKRKYEIGPPEDKEKWIEFYFEYNKKRIILANLPKKEVENHPEIEDALKLSSRIKLGFFSNELYKNKKISSEIPLNIVNTYPVHFVLANSNSCNQKLYWKGITTTKTLNLNDTSVYRREREWVNKLPEDVLINIIGTNVLYYQSRRYVFIENDSLIFISNVNRGCELFNNTLNNLASIPLADYWESRDGINNYLVKIEDDLWGWIFRYGCTVESRLYDKKQIRKILTMEPSEIFKELHEIKPLNATILNETCM